MRTSTDELLILAETLGEVKARLEKIEGQFATQALPLEAATKALAASLDGIRALNFAVLETRIAELEKRLTSQ